MDDYTDEAIRQAFLADEASRVMQENADLFAFSNSHRPAYGTTALDEPEVTLSDVDESLVNTAMVELAAERGVSVTDLAELVFTMSGEEYDTESRALAIVELANMDPAELVSLAAQDDDEDEDDEDEAEHMAEHQGHEGPRLKKAKRKRKPAPVKRGQHVAAEAGSPSGGEGPAGSGDGGSMAASSAPGGRWSAPVMVRS
jgi:hypothetical protein